MFKLDLEKAEEAWIKLPTPAGSQRKQENSRKISTSVSLTTPKPLTVWITTNCGKFFKRWEYQITLSAPWEICMQIKKQQLELDIEKWTASKLGNEYIKTILSPCLFKLHAECLMWNAGQDELNLELRLLGEISITSDMQMIPTLGIKAKRNWRASWWNWKRRVKKLA